MKKAASILAVVLFTIGMFATQTNDILNTAFDIENALACDGCSADKDDRDDPNV